jgi:hypothetical protein
MVAPSLKCLLKTSLPAVGYEELLYFDIVMDCKIMAIGQENKN